MIPEATARRAVAILALSLTWALATAAPVAAEEDSQPYIIESYYRIRWGHFDEFMALFKKNHYPILARLQELGHIVSMEAAFPVNHASEESRWDWRMTITIADRRKLDAFELAFAEVKSELYPDAEALAVAEQRRFSLLLAHTDVPIQVDDLSSW